MASASGAEPARRLSRITSAIRRGARLTYPKTSSPFVINATAKCMERKYEVSTARNVGTSARTPAKHKLLNRTVGRVVGALRHVRPGAAFHAYDLCGGDGLVPLESDTDWWHGCSPGILINHARHAALCGAEAHVELYENARATFDQLIVSLSKNICEPGWFGDGVAEFVVPTGSRGVVTVRAILGSGHDATVGQIHSGDCVFVNNDPNKITDWAMRPTFVQEINARTRLCTTFSTMGCNVGGLKRISQPERDMWYSHLSAVQESLPSWHDMMLAAIDRDESQWAYLLSVPSKWAQKTETETVKCFNEIGKNMRVEWMRQAPAGFAKLTDELFLTKTELKMKAEAALW
jgi:hypothetical protein